MGHTVFPRSDGNSLEMAKRQSPPHRKEMKVPSKKDTPHSASDSRKRETLTETLKF